MAEKAEELRNLDDKKLREAIDEAYREQFNLRFRHATRQLENYAELTYVRQKIARLRTIQRERQLGIER
jgi:large subunit ribosomal protein L29